MFSNRIFKVLGNLILLALIFSLIGVTPAYAATLIVTNTNDSGSGSLRDTIATAGAGDTITFASGLSGATIRLITELTISKNVTINGSTLASKITISGDTDNNGIGDVRVFYIYNAVGPSVILDSLIITKGVGGSAGGGVYKNRGSLTVINSTLSNNSADAGGGIYNQIGTLTVTNSTFSSNTANSWSGSAGGGIANEEFMTVTNSTFSNNTSRYGGGIFNQGKLTVTNSTFTSNSATSGGGGIWNQDMLTVTNSTLSNNYSSSYGGGIGSSTSGAVTVTNSTVSGNSGGGIYSVNGTLNYANTIIANSSLGNDCGPNNAIGININNLVEDGSCSASLNGDPKLGTLANNGGLTQTFALLAGSIAIDAGNDIICAAAPVSNTSQNGVIRPQGSHCDIGAFEEYQLPKPPLIIVHGFQGLAFDGGYHCTNDGHGADDVEMFKRDDDTHSNSTLSPKDGTLALANWLSADYDVWIAHLETSPLGTPPLETNAQCLRDQINTVYQLNPQQITIVAHSMGGVVSRAAIRYLNNPNKKVKALYTLGSPHAGLPSEIISILPIARDLQKGAYDMSVSHMMTTFNPSNPNVADIAYNFIGGNGGVGKFDLLLKLAKQGTNDGLVGQYSTVGWINPDQIFAPSDWASNSIPRQYFTNETHPNFSPANKAYYLAQDGQGFSDSFGCIDALIKGNTPNPNHCWPAGSQALQVNSADANTLSTSVSSFTEIKTGHLNAGQMVILPFVIDSVGTTLFYLNWSGGNAPSFVLTRPDAQVIDPAYAATHPSEVAYETAAGSPEAAPNATYDFVSGQVGTWQATITATDTIDYKIFGLIDSALLLTANTNAEVYQIGDTATITANLDSGGIGLSGATVTATMTRSDDVVDIVSLTGQGNGTYTNTYTIPDASGYLSIDITVNGSDNGTTFTRQKNLLVAIAPNDLQLTGSYGDQPRDDNADGLYDYLDFTAEVNLVSPGEYAMSAELYAGDQLITQSGDFFKLVAGTQTVILPFDGTAIFAAGLNGPYTVKNMYFTPIDIGITAQSVENAWTTDAYSFTQFVNVVSPFCSWSSFTAPASPTFGDVPMNVATWSWVERLSKAGITAGCGGGNFCPGNEVNRAQMAIFLLRGKYCGSGYIPPSTGGSSGFNDVPADSTIAPWVKQLAVGGITAGCGSGNFCPGTVVNRAQMAIFLLRAKHGGAYIPPAVGGSSGFNDVPADSTIAPWVKQLAAEGITAGCGNGNFCPGDNVNRAQMAIFLVRAFGLP